MALFRRRRSVGLSLDRSIEDNSAALLMARAHGRLLSSIVVAFSCMPGSVSYEGVCQMIDYPYEDYY